MKHPARQASLWLVLAAGAVAAGLAHAAQDPSPEAQAIAVLKSAAPAPEKAVACRTLKLAGTARAVPALAPLLADKDLSHMARYALETMPCPEAGAALRNALPNVADELKVGLINSLGERHDRQAVAALATLAGHADAQVASSALAALGKIGGPQAARALLAARAKAPKSLARALLDATLACADQLLAAGDAKGAEALYEALRKPGEPAYVRRAGFRGLVVAGGDKALPILADALAGDDAQVATEALQIARSAPGAKATAMLASLLAKLTPAKQAMVLGALAERADSAAAGAVMAQTRSSDAAVRVAAFNALATVGDASAVAPLVKAAATTKGAEQEAARAALDRIPGEDADKAVLAQLKGAEPATAVEVARALAARRVRSAVPTLLELARAGDAPVRTAAAASLGELADESTVGPMVNLLCQAKTDADRTAAENALASVCGRSKRPEACAGPVLAAMNGADVPVRSALMRVAGRIGGSEVHQVLKAGLADKDAAIQESALRTLAQYGGPAALVDLLGVATDAPKLAHRVLALRGYWRIVGLAADRPAEERWRMCRAGMAASQRPDEKKLGLTELAKVPHPDALKLAEQLAADETVRTEAEAACVGIATSLAATHPAEAKAALRRVAADSKNENVRTQARKAIGEVDRYAGYIMPWLAAGPYRQQGKECQALYDIAFGPEKPGEKVEWKPAPKPADAALFWQVDLGSLVGGDHCIAYLKTRVYSPRDQRVRLEIGTDDGIKLWVNGKLVHANNAVRALTPDQDKAEADLKTGWNDFLAKITQHTAGCGACIKVRRTDGSLVEGLRFDPGG